MNVFNSDINFGFSLYTALSVSYVVVTLDKWMKFEIELSADLVYCY